MPEAPSLPYRFPSCWKPLLFCTFGSATQSPNTQPSSHVLYYWQPLSALLPILLLPLLTLLVKSRISLLWSVSLTWWLSPSHGCSSNWALVFTVLVQIIRLIVVAHMTVLKVGDYLEHVVLPVAIYSVLCLAAPLALKLLLDNGWMRLLLILVVSVVSSFGFAWLIGLNKSEKKFVTSKLKSIRKRNKKVS